MTSKHPRTDAFVRGYIGHGTPANAIASLQTFAGVLEEELIDAEGRIDELKKTLEDSAKISELT